MARPDEVIRDAGSETLADWWCELNRWGWPEELGEPELKEDSRLGRRRRIMDEIAKTIGMRKCLIRWRAQRSEEP